MATQVAAAANTPVSLKITIAGRNFAYPIPAETLWGLSVGELQEKIQVRYDAILARDADGEEKKEIDAKQNKLRLIKFNSAELFPEDKVQDLFPRAARIVPIVGVLYGEPLVAPKPVGPGYLRSSPVVSADAGFSIEGDGEDCLIVIEDTNLKNYIRTTLAKNDLMYDPKPKIIADTLLVDIEKLKKATNSLYKKAFQPLIEFLEKKFAGTKARIDNMMKDNRISYATLWHVFHTGVEIYTHQNGDSEFLVGTTVKSINYYRGLFPVFEIKGNLIKSDGERFGAVATSFYIGSFKGTKLLSELPIQVLDPKTKAHLTARGKSFVKHGLGCHYKSYDANMYRRTNFGGLWFRAQGRVMVDAKAFNRFNPSYRGFKLGSTSMYGSRNTGSNNAIGDVEEDQLFMTSPTLAGFSFTNKKWGEILVSKLEDVVFDETAYEKLVIPAEKKSLIKALVEHSKSTFSDIISGKGGGCIFLLHGSPGVGKTLTAEAIAEMLHRPLYSVSVGELGTNTSSLEKTLGQILEVAAGWRSVILIDEADIFLEARTENDIDRNAMVGIFLRLLEYHQGVLFLTTNRVKCFDRAFHSRISVALKYEDLNEDTRRQIWENLLLSANVKGIDAKRWAKFDLNGRQIRSAIRLSQALAKSENIAVDDEVVGRCVSICTIGSQDFLLNK
eukprot:TRINITY_DN11814_c0_g1_i1.p1 TRINITY_DN11814_c0_g1~~TRINITY_DN11814_c0_g1_i1.p1  ORF type:complete len:671 (+),score=98.41 TRINITY_DN11814_c0_g1_i1:29-2041(+)